MTHTLLQQIRVSQGQAVHWDEVEADTTLKAYKIRMEMEDIFFGKK